MAWEGGGGPRRGGDDDLTGVHGDVLFADPLGVRSDKAKPGAQPPAVASNAPRGGALREARRDPTPKFVGDNDIDSSRDNALDMNLPAHRRAELNRSDINQEPQVEDPVGLRSWFGAIFGGGTQCCGNRDRDKDKELAKKASIVGRPPTRQEKPFPDPHSKAAPSNEANTNGRRHGAEEEESTRPNFREAPKPGQEDPFATGKRSGGGVGGLDELHKFAAEEPSRGALKKDPLPAEQPRPQEPPRPPQVQQRMSIDGAGSKEKPPEGHLPMKWQWPTWTLNSKQGAIEVYVTDEDSGESRWCEAEPQFRVVDKEGHDAYLCAEYEWDGEFYVQDFGPHHVRKRGQDMTVFQLFALDPSVVNEDFMKDTLNQSSKSVGRRNLDDTDPFMTTTRPRPGNRNDSGGGVSNWLERD